LSAYFSQTLQQRDKLSKEELISLMAQTTHKDAHKHIHKPFWWQLFHVQLG